jgi:hypothetical protein
MRDNREFSILLGLGNDGSFAVSLPAAALNVPLSGGRDAYDDAPGMLQVTGVDNAGSVFSEVIHVFEREGDHFHANYQGIIWELESDD